MVCLSAIALLMGPRETVDDLPIPSAMRPYDVPLGVDVASDDQPTEHMVVPVEIVDLSAEMTEPVADEQSVEMKVTEISSGPAWLQDDAIEKWIEESAPKVKSLESACGDKSIAAFDEIQARFAEWKSQISAYVREVLSLESKFQLASGLVQWNEDHRRHQMSALERHLVTLSEIDSLIAEMESRITQDHLDCDDAAFVAARVDVPAESTRPLALEIEREAIASCFERILNAAESVSKVDAGVAIGTEIVSDQVADSIAHSLMDALGIERTFLNTVIAEDLVQNLTDPLAQSVSQAMVDTTNEMTVLVQQELFNIERILMVGTDGNGGVINQVSTFDEQRREHRLRRLFDAYTAKGAY
ncbi:hypothetical protein [Caulifigura coniformis]|nr:hypothetical protein [Caulifigura coniformis]